MADILQPTFSNAFSSMKTFVFCLKFHRRLFPRVFITTSQRHRFTLERYLLTKTSGMPGHQLKSRK